MATPDHPYVSRGGLKLAAGLDAFAVDPAGRSCVDLGCSTGGFTDVLLRREAAKVFAVDTGYGVLDWNLRNDVRVIVMERTNAMHVELPEPVSIAVADAGWTRQAKLLPTFARLLAIGGDVVTLVKPHYEGHGLDLRKHGGVLPDEALPATLDAVRDDVAAAGFEVVAEVESPVRGSSGKNAKGNREFLFHLKRLA